MISPTTKREALPVSAGSVRIRNQRYSVNVFDSFLEGGSQIMTVHLLTGRSARRGERPVANLTLTPEDVIFCSQCYDSEKSNTPCGFILAARIFVNQLRTVRS